MVLVPGNLEEAKEILSRYPTAPPGRTIPLTMAKKVRQCHGCHGFNDEDHETIPLGASKCPLQHDDRCPGGIVGGKDSKGREWRACTGTLGTDLEDSDGDGDDESEEEEEFEDTLADEDGSLYRNPGNFAVQTSTCGPLQPKLSGIESFLPPTSSGMYTSSVRSPPTTSSAGTSPSGAYFQPTSLATHTTTVSSAQNGSILSTQLPQQSNLESDIVALQKLRLERESLEQQARLVEQQQLSAKQVEITRQLKAEKDRIKNLKKINKQQFSQPQKADAILVENLRQQSQSQALPSSFHSHYNGPNIKEIRKTHGLRNSVEDVLDTVRYDNPSLARRPTAGHHLPTTHAGKPLGARKKRSKVTIDPMMAEFERFKAWRENQSAMAAVSESESDASPPRAAGIRKTVALEDPITGSSSSEDDSSQPMVLVYRRDSNGIKYRSYEPANSHSQTGHSLLVIRVVQPSTLGSRILPLGGSTSNLCNLNSHHMFNCRPE